MARTTLNLDDPVLRDLKQLQARRKESLGKLVSELLAEALARHRKGAEAPPPFRWHSQVMGARLDLTDKDAVDAALDAEG